VVPNGVDLAVATADDVARVRAAYAIGDAPYVLWNGSFQPRKNLRVLLDAFARLDPVAFPARLVLVGAPGWRLAEGDLAHGLGARVVDVGRVPSPDLAALHAGAEVFAFPSLHEGFGLPVLEAMAQSTAVACSDIPALREVAGDTARLLDPRDADAWADALRELLGDDARRADLGRRGRARAEGFSWDRCVAGTVAVYAEALRDT
jgi:glycosyltransferase involved in cell wall biosynthesis